MLQLCPHAEASSSPPVFALPPVHEPPATAYSPSSLLTPVIASSGQRHRQVILVWCDFVASPLGSNADASAPHTPRTAASAAATSSWEKPRGLLPLSLFGADQEVGQEEEGPAGPLPTATTPQRAGPFTTDGSMPTDLKDLIANLYGSQPPPAAGAADPGLQEEAEDGGGLGDNYWEFTAATAEPAGKDRGGRAPGDGSANIEMKTIQVDQQVIAF